MRYCIDYHGRLVCCSQTSVYVLARYGKSVVIVFDGYLDGPSIKDASLKQSERRHN